MEAPASPLPVLDRALAAQRFCFNAGQDCAQPPQPSEHSSRCDESIALVTSERARERPWNMCPVVAHLSARPLSWRTNASQERIYCIVASE